MWGLLTHMILRGHGRNVPGSVRFGHYEIVTGDGFPANDEIKEVFIRVFTKPEYDFPWIVKPGSHKQDKRLLKADMTNVFCGDLRDIPFSGASVNAPAVLIAVSLSMEEERCVIQRAIVQRPFVIVLKEYNLSTNKFYVGHILCNHEYMDGLPAAYYLNLFLRELGFKATDAQHFIEGIPSLILSEADLRESSEPQSAFSPNARLLGREITETIQALFEKTRKSCSEAGLTVSFDVFVHLIMFASLQQCKGIRGAALRFLPAMHEQLDFYRIGDVYGLLDAMLKDPSLIRKNYSDYLVKDKYIGLFCPGKNVVGSVVSPIAYSLPVTITRWLGSFASFTGASRAMIGQVVVTGVPHELVLDGRKINLGLSYGGPACAPFQDAALTVGYVKDEQNQIRDILVRTKFRKPVPVNGAESPDYSGK